MVAREGLERGICGRKVPKGRVAGVGLRSLGWGTSMDLAAATITGFVIDGQSGASYPPFADGS